MAMLVGAVAGCSATKEPCESDCVDSPAATASNTSPTSTSAPSASPSVTPTSPASNPTVPSVPTTVGGGTGANDSSSGEPTLDTSSEPSGAGKSDVDGTASETDGSQTLPTSEGCAVLAPSGHFQMEALDRGLIAVRNGDGNFVAWRMLGYEFDAD